MPKNERHVWSQVYYSVKSAPGQSEKNSVRVYVFRFALKLRHCSTQPALRICANKRHHGSQNWNTLSQSALRISLAHGDRIADFEEHQVRAETVLAWTLENLVCQSL